MQLILAAVFGSFASSWFCMNETLLLGRHSVLLRKLVTEFVSLLILPLVYLRYSDFGEDA